MEKKRKNRNGVEMPESYYSKLDLQSDDLTIDLVPKAMALSQALRDFKTESFSMVLMHMEDVVKFEGAESPKENIYLESLDGTMRIETTRKRIKRMGELVHRAIGKLKQWVDERGSLAPELKVMIENDLKNPQSRTTAERLLSFKEYKFDDELWKSAMADIAEAWKDSGSKDYMRFYVREGMEDKFRFIVLNFSAV